MFVWIIGFIIYLIFCFVIASGAQNRGRSYGGYFALSFFLSPLIAIIILLVLGETDENKKARIVQQISLNENINKEKQGELKKCPFCAEEIKKEAIVCRFCGKDIPNENDNKLVINNQTENEIKQSSENISDDNKNMEIDRLEKLFDSTTDENEKGIIAKQLYDLGKMYYWRFIPKDKK